MELSQIDSGIGAEKMRGGSSPRLVGAAHEFEGQMIKELLKPLTGGGGLTGAEDDSDSGSGGALGEFASETLGLALSAKGGFGIANRIIQEPSHPGNQPENGKVTKTLNQNKGLRASQ